LKNQDSGVIIVALRFSAAGHCIVNIKNQDEERLTMTHSRTPAGWTRKIVAILIFVLSTAVRVHGQQPHDSSLSEWPGWRGPKRDGKSPDSGLLREWPDGGPRLLWKVDDIGKGYSSVSVSDGVIYTSGDVSGRLFIFAFDMNGEPRWKADHDKACTRIPPGSRATPTIDAGNLYLLSGNGWVCLDLKTGQKKGQSRGVGRGSMCFADGMMYLFSERGGAAGLMTCSPEGLEMKGRFSVQGSGPSFAHPVVVGGRLYLRYDSNLYHLLWSG
jgi:hypothetical protein